MRTPPFLRWALERQCPLREHRQWRDPQQTERQLRPLREYSRAVFERRLFEGVCVRQHTGEEDLQRPHVKGFQEREVLQAYGAPEELERLCGACPANAAAAMERGALAGCYGMLPIDDDNSQLAARLSQAAEKLAREHPAPSLFRTSTPAHYGLWIDSPPSSRQISGLLIVLRAAQLDGAGSAGRDADQSLRLLIAALELAQTNELPIHLSLYPPGRVVDDNWIVDSHCRRCKASRAAASASCRVCGLRGRPAAAQRRHNRGDRPYWPIANFLGPAQAEAFLARYNQYRRTIAGRTDDAG